MLVVRACLLSGGCLSGLVIRGCLGRRIRGAVSGFERRFAAGDLGLAGLGGVLPLVIWGWLVWAMLRRFGRGLVCLWIGLPTGRSRWGGCAEEMGKCFDAGLLHAGRGGVCRKGRDVLAIWFVDGC